MIKMTKKLSTAVLLLGCVFRVGPLLAEDLATSTSNSLKVETSYKEQLDIGFDEFSGDMSANTTLSAQAALKGNGKDEVTLHIVVVCSKLNVFTFGGHWDISESFTVDSSDKRKDGKSGDLVLTTDLAMTTDLSQNEKSFAKEILETLKANEVASGTGINLETDAAKRYEEMTTYMGMPHARKRFLDGMTKTAYTDREEAFAEKLAHEILARLAPLAPAKLP